MDIFGAFGGEHGGQLAAAFMAGVTVGWGISQQYFVKQARETLREERERAKAREEELRSEIAVLRDEVRQIQSRLEDELRGRRV